MTTWHQLLLTFMFAVLELFSSTDVFPGHKWWVTGPVCAEGSPYIMFPFPAVHKCHCAPLGGRRRAQGQTVNSAQASGMALRQMSCNDLETQGYGSTRTVSVSLVLTHYHTRAWGFCSYFFFFFFFGILAESTASTAMAVFYLHSLTRTLTLSLLRPLCW